MGALNRNHSVWVLPFLAVSTAAALGVRLWGLHRPFWLDEYATAWVVRDGFAPIFERAWLNNLSPAYFLIVRLSAVLFGYNEAGLRLPSMIAGALLVPAVYALARTMGLSPILAAIGGLLTAFDPTSLAFSIDTRPYALVQLAGVVQVWVFLQLVYRQPTLSAAAVCWRVCVYAVLTAFLAYLHLLALLLLLPEVAFCLYWTIAGKPGGTKPLSVITIGLVLAAVLCLPLVPHLQHLFAVRDVLGSFVTPQPLLNVISRFSALRYLALALPAAALTEVVVRRLRPNAIVLEPNPIVLPSFAFAVAWFVLPNLFTQIVTRIDLARIDLSRYLAVAGIAPILIAVTACGVFRTQIAKYVCLGMVFLSLHLTGDRVCFEAACGTYRLFAGNEEWRRLPEMVSFINANCDDGRPIFINTELVEGQWLVQRSNDLLPDYLLSTVNTLHPISTAGSRALIAPMYDPNSLAMHRDAIIEKRGCYLVFPGNCFVPDLDVVKQSIEQIVNPLAVGRGAPLVDVAQIHDHVFSVRLLPR